MNENEKALDALIDEAMEQEKSLSLRAEELSLQSKQFADYLAEKKHNDEKLEVLWDLVKEYMTENNITEHENDYIRLTLSPSGRFKLAEDTDIADVDDNLCDIKKVLNNKKVKAYQELNGKLPEGVEPTSMVLRKKLKEQKSTTALTAEGD